ncbi:nitrite/sulfite reductase [Oceanibacterium hippocampi]|uniref:Sulfite reductase [ferredoxin] n=1 Tax=Oceanibacterium hippocampi TaxID=745714 RepID=A0A1Y5RAL5_9PROT|nr:nitrite/sulfite reductase [Oceanibacterium hippocampi]SLN10451.1 Sulfite reductase [ferredoxin] [Oceanibacterium hippocampi]
MYQYDRFDHQMVRERVAQFRGQVARRLNGELTEDEFKPLRLRNGVYLQLHAYMLRVAIPYGLLASRQLRKLAHIARRYDKGYGHFSTRQNIQYNWPRLDEVPDILAELAEVEMHTIQTSGNCIRNTTADHLAGVAVDEIEDPRPYCELVRQWSTFHPEFNWLPRKFKIAISGGAQDRAALAYHDIGLRLVKNDAGEIGFEVMVGGGLGRTPMIAKTIREFLPKQHLLSYLEAILRVYNMLGRRDNIFKARIKILVHEHGIEKIRELVEADWEATRDGALALRDEDIAGFKAFFAPPPYETLPANDSGLAQQLESDPAFARWHGNAVIAHRVPGYAAVDISLKTGVQAPGDVTDDQMDAIADLADRYSFGQIRVNHRQNLLFADVRQSDLHALWQALVDLDLATPNNGKLTDIISCPGMDFCSLATARSIPVALDLQRRFEDLDHLYDLGDLTLNISGCINACAHHHAGNIGILGVNKKGEELYQLLLGGSSRNDASIGAITGPGFAPDAIVGAVEDVLAVYLERREGPEETFLEVYRRLGDQPFKERLYG